MGTQVCRMETYLRLAGLHIDLFLPKNNKSWQSSLEFFRNMNRRFLSFLLLFLSLWIVLSFFNNGKGDKNGANTADIVITSKNSWVIGQLVNFTVKNNTTQDIILGDSQNPPDNFVFEQWFNGNWEKLDIKNPQIDFGRTILAPGAKQKFDFSVWNNEIFDEIGKYRVSIERTVDGTDQMFSTEFELEESGLMRSMWRTIFFKPIFNILIFFVSVFPGHNLALAIMALTILIKIILLGPSKKALLQQQKMQKVQKELDGVRKKNAGDQQKIAQETMAIWKKHDVNPFASFLPMLIQFPVMIALFFVVKEGLMPHNSLFLWPMLEGFDLSLVSSDFLGIMDLRSVGVWWLAILIGVLQFGSMKLALVQRKKKEKGKKSDDKKDATQDQMQMMNMMMTYGLPVMIAKTC